MWKIFPNILKKKTVTRRPLGETGLSLPTISFGCSILPMKENGKIDETSLQKNVDFAIKKGINLFDLGWQYHGCKAESAISKVLKKHKREDYLLSDKFPTWVLNEKSKEEIFETQLQRLNTDYFDLYMIHSLSGNAYTVMKSKDLYKYLMEKKTERKIKALGFSFNGAPDLLEELLDNYQWDFVALQINYIEWKFGNAQKLYNLAIKKDIPILVIEALREGNLVHISKREERYFTDTTPASLALRFAANLKNITSVICRTKTLKHLKENAKTFTDLKHLTEEEKNFITNFVPDYTTTKNLPCNGCEKCNGICDINIREIFFIYNHILRSKEPWFFIDTYNSLLEKEKADKCNNCNYCDNICPLGINIKTELQKIDKLRKDLKKRFNA